MRKKLVALLAFFTLLINLQIANAYCPCQNDFCCPCNISDCCIDPCCEDWLCPYKIEDYLCRIGLNECQKCQARKAVWQFACCTQCLRNKRCKCESKRDCRSYRRALWNLDCQMKSIMTKCQKSDYRYIRKEIKNQVGCCHHCLINPFRLCRCGCK